MMRRWPAAVDASRHHRALSAHFVHKRAQSSGGGGGGRSRQDRGRLHNYIRDSNTPSSAASTPYTRQASAATGGSPEDWTAQLQRELLRDVDPLGGMAHKDYYRDPARGYAPLYAPRNFSYGGEVAYPHVQTASQYAEAAAWRRRLEHDVSSMKETAQSIRAASRQLETPEEQAALLRGVMPSERLRPHVTDNASRHVLSLLQHSSVTSKESLRQQSLVHREQLARDANPVSYTAAGDDPQTSTAAWAAQLQDARDNVTAEYLRIVQGQRAKERSDFEVMQRSTRLPFGGYDRDRFEAQQRGTPYGAQQLPPSLPPASLEEAQQTLRGTALPAEENLFQRAYAGNTVSAQPKLGEALTEDIVRGLRSSRAVADEERERRRRQRFGLGRQGALVQDGGPDKRVLRRHQNDERMVDAMRFASDAYRRTPTDEHANPYIRRSTERGVGHLLTNAFDVQRRADRVAAGAPDTTELSTVHYGVPIAQSMDEFVFRHRNARGERPLDYFKPFPKIRALRLARMYSDTEGFSLMKQRPDFLEWELFVRYRAHHQQRRELALLHGFEPVRNETAGEREARRVALDALCEKTPFDPSKLHLNDDELAVGVETLRGWFGVFMLPSPTVLQNTLAAASAVSLHLQHANDALGTADTREHLLSARYFNQLLLLEGYQHRIGRGFAGEVVGRAPEPVIRYAQPPQVLRYFSAEERAMYENYVGAEVTKQLGAWQKLRQGRRFIPEHGCYGHVVAEGSATPVVDVVHQESGAFVTVSSKQFEAALQEARRGSGAITVDGELYRLPSAAARERQVVPLQVKLETGEVLETTDERFSQCALEVDASAVYQHHLNFGIADYTYNRANYIETQDILWERATAEGVEGWSPATHADGLRAGMPVRARRHLGSATNDSGTAPYVPDAAARVVADYQRGRLVLYDPRPFFNPEPRQVTVAFAADGVVQSVPLTDVLIWQRQYHGPERTTGDESRRYNPAGLRRYIDVADPDNSKVSREVDETSVAAPHFLEKYEAPPASGMAAAYRTTKQITEIDAWTRHDTRRAENHRPLSISHRRDYIRLGYMHHYTPWEWIAVQEGDQPIVSDTIRSDNLGASPFFSLNRFWRYKARPHGYLRHFDKEVRDMVQFVDGVTPWRQAQKIRSYWEVRQHHPMPQFNRPEVAMHRNTAGLLPTHLWDTERKTGKVKGVKDSVRDYKTTTPLPKWVQL